MLNGNRRKCALLLALTSIAPITLDACAHTPSEPIADAPLKLAPNVDLDRYMGRWYIIANVPYFAERGFVGSYVEYSKRADGDIDDIFFGHKKTFDSELTRAALKDYVVEGTHNAKWRASPFWPIYFSYPIIYVDADYQYALIGYPDKSWGWIFARSPQMSDAKYQDLLQHFAAQGYDISTFKRVPQTPEQLGQPGFQTPQ
jgi:apolipoprotein D and lipocalin family protein